MEREGIDARTGSGTKREEPDERRRAHPKPGWQSRTKHAFVALTSACKQSFILMVEHLDDNDL